MNRYDVGVAWYRTRAGFGRRRNGYLAIILVVGLIGGVAMGAIAAARRTLSSYPTFLASTNPSDIVIFGGAGNTSSSSTSAYSSTLERRIARLPGVRHVETGVVANMAPLTAQGTPRLNLVPSLAPIASVDGLFFNQGRAGVVSGRLANPRNPNEVMMDAGAASLLGVHVGQKIPMGVFTGAQTASPGFGTTKVPPTIRFDATVVGIIMLSNQVVQDDIDKVPDFMIFTPALARRVLAMVNSTMFGVQLEPGTSVAAFERELIASLPTGFFYQFHVTASATAKVQGALRPEGSALAIFGGIAGLVALLLGLQVIARQLRANDDELRTLRALGAGPSTAALDALLGVFGAIAIGSVLALGVALALSPLGPLGPVRPVYPARGFAADWTVLGIGSAGLIFGLGTMAALLAGRAAPHRRARHARFVYQGPSRVAAVAASTGFPVTGVVGVSFAFESGRGQDTVPVRSMLLGAVLTVVMVTATLTFGSSLRSLVTHPRLYGWNWNYALTSSNDVPPPALAMLAHDPKVAAFSGVSFAEGKIDGVNVPVVLGGSRPAVNPPILSGHAVEAPDQIVLGGATMVALGKHLGQTVTVSYGSPRQYPAYIPPTPLRIVGVATFPAMGYTSFVQDHPSMGIGAQIAKAMAPAYFRRANSYQDPLLNGPSVVYVRMRLGVSQSAGRADLGRIARSATAVLDHDPNAAGNSVSAAGVQRPAQIVNYRSMGATPTILASGLALGATVALALTLTASVRRRRRELALLKTLGFSRRDLAATLAWQASTVALLSVVIGVPLGLALGRQLWILFAHSIYAVAAPSVPTVQLVLVGLGTMIFANAVAAFPGRLAARTSPALVLRAE